METIARDLTTAVRSLAARPMLAATVALRLGLGVGAATVVFSLVEAVLLRPLPYADPDRLTAVWLTSAREKELSKIFAMRADFEEFRQQAKSFESLAVATWASGRNSRVWTQQGEKSLQSREILVLPVSENFFSLFGVAPVRGRTFRPDDDPNGCALVLSHSFWLTSRAQPGTTLTLDQKPCEVLGVMPAEFGFFPSATKAWTLLPSADDPARVPVGIFGRLQPGVTPERAEAELGGLFRARHSGDWARDIRPMVRGLHGEFRFLAGRTLESTLRMVFAAVLGLLLVACLNVANLLSARVEERQREFAVRSALGSGRRRLIQQVLVEGLVLASLGAATAVALAYAGVECFRRWSPIEMPVGAGIAVNWKVLLFGLTMGLATTLVFAALPAIRASRVDPARDLKASGRSAIAGGGRMASMLIALEVSLCFVLITGASLLLGSALRMGAEPLGFDPHRAVTTRVTPRERDEPKRLRQYEQLLERVRALPGVTHAAFTSKAPPEVGGNQAIERPGREVPAASEIHNVGADAVSPGAFAALGVPLRRGRDFDLQDRAPSEPVVIINEALARQYFRDTDPIGQQLRVAGGRMPWMTIVGVVGNLKHTELMNEMLWVETPILYRPMAQEARPGLTLVVRGQQVQPNAIHEQISRIDGRIPLNDIDPLEQGIAQKLAFPRFRATALTLFASLALLLAAVGIHGVVAQLVGRRMSEFGLRRALGAPVRHLAGLVARGGLGPVVLGIALGAVAALAWRRVLAGLVYGSEADPVTSASAALIILAAATIAMLRPTWRAIRADPATALRNE